MMCYYCLVLYAYAWRKKKWNEGLNTRLLVSKVCTKEKSMVKQTKIKLEKQQEAEGKYSVVRRHHTGT